MYLRFYRLFWGFLCEVAVILRKIEILMTSAERRNTAIVSRPPHEVVVFEAQVASRSPLRQLFNGAVKNFQYIGIIVKRCSLP